ncbi:MULTISPECIES: TIR domain-containing protein [Kordiimonas]|jgi:hypothetical protein|uniref:TIR domain-containing protein n=1 Tax=Kordiimonas TaxID=288021 RepID=UPI00257E4879|nr:TIR domain-containing protein [Kordiimonas sp. UBA4487]
MTERKIFLTYDFCHDSGLYRQFMRQLAQDKERAMVAAHSMDYCHSHSEIISSLNSAVARVDGLIVLVGKHTHRAGNVMQEVRAAHNLELPVVQLGGFSGTWCAGLSDHIPYFDWRAFSVQQMFENRRWHSGVVGAGTRSNTANSSGYSH